jgi:hypothetical protein
VDRVGEYSAYGVPHGLPVGTPTATGTTTPRRSGGTYALLEDTELDGDVDAADITHAASIAGGYHTLGRGVLSSPEIGNQSGTPGTNMTRRSRGVGGL